MRFFLDANVLFSAAYSPVGRARALFRLAETERCALIASPHVIEEAARNVKVKAAHRLEDLEELLNLVERASEAPSKIVAWARTKGLPDKDAPVLAAAISCGSDGLVTGDRKHFGHLFGHEFAGTKVLSLRRALAAVLEAGND